MRVSWLYIVLGKVESVQCVSPQPKDNQTTTTSVIPRPVAHLPLQQTMSSSYCLPTSKQNPHLSIDTTVWIVRLTKIGWQFSIAVEPVIILTGLFWRISISDNLHETSLQNKSISYNQLKMCKMAVFTYSVSRHSMSPLREKPLLII